MRCVLYLLLILSLPCQGQDLRVHDPVMAKAGSTYYLFSTGRGISVYSSGDMLNWKQEQPVFASPPAWAVRDVPGFKGHIWAPDISYHNGRYYLYYSVSAFGKNTSCIGVATNTTLDPLAKNFEWIDHGKVIQSVPNRDLWNAIDPNLVWADDQPWLAFGSFWGGIKLVKLDSTLLLPARPEVWHTISKRLRDFKTRDDDAGEGAVEAPFVFAKGKFFYLFVSFDACCRGMKSTYKMMVGRSESIEGPYVDRNGVPMNEGGGSLMLGSSERWAGAGHNAIYTFDGVDYLVYHAYDKKDEGKSKLQIKALTWQDGWPVVLNSEK